MKHLTESAGSVAEFEEEFDKLRNDREVVRQIFPTGDARVRTFQLYFVF